MKQPSLFGPFKFTFRFLPNNAMLLTIGSYMEGGETMDLDVLALRGKTEPEAYAETLTREDLSSLVPLLQEKDDALRYAAFLTLCARSRTTPDVFAYWDIFSAKLTDENSYQRSIGLMLIAHNVKWDTAGLFESVLKTYMSCCNDRSFVTRRQAINNISLWAPYAQKHLRPAAQMLMEIDVAACKETQRKLLLQDICFALIELQRFLKDVRISSYLHHAVTGGILDKKTAKRLMDALP